jgi:hypothetical protein
MLRMDNINIQAPKPSLPDRPGFSRVTNHQSPITLFSNRHWSIRNSPKPRIYNQIEISNRHLSWLFSLRRLAPKATNSFFGTAADMRDFAA